MDVAATILARARDAAGLSQAALARRAGMPRSVLCAYERGRRDPGGQALAALVAAAGFELRLAIPVRDVDPERAGRILVDVLDLAELLPFRRRRELPPSPFPSTTT